MPPFTVNLAHRAQKQRPSLLTDGNHTTLNTYTRSNDGPTHLGFDDPGHIRLKDSPDVKGPLHGHSPLADARPDPGNVTIDTPVESSSTSRSCNRELDSSPSHHRSSIRGDSSNEAAKLPTGREAQPASQPVMPRHDASEFAALSISATPASLRKSSTDVQPQSKVTEIEKQTDVDLQLKAAREVFRARNKAVDETKRATTRVSSAGAVDRSRPANDTNQPRSYTHIRPGAKVTAPPPSWELGAQPAVVSGLTPPSSKATAATAASPASTVVATGTNKPTPIVSPNASATSASPHVTDAAPLVTGDKNDSGGAPSRHASLGVINGEALDQVCTAHMLTEVLRAFQGQISTLAAQVASLTDERDQFKSQADEHKVVLEVARLMTVKSEKDAFQVERDQLEARLAAMQSKLDAANEDKVHAKEATLLAQSETLREGLRSQVIAFKTDFVSVKTQVQKMAPRIETLEAQDRTLANKYRQLQEKHAELQERTDRLERSNQELEGRLAKLDKLK